MVNELLVKGLAPDMITLVQPAVPTCFPDEMIGRRVNEALASTDVKMLTGCVLSGWLVCDGGLSGVQLEDSSGLTQTVTCTTVVYMGEKTVDSDTFKGNPLLEF